MALEPVPLKGIGKCENRNWMNSEMKIQITFSALEKGVLTWDQEWMISIAILRRCCQALFMSVIRLHCKEEWNPLFEII